MTLSTTGPTPPPQPRASTRQPLGTRARLDEAVATLAPAAGLLDEARARQQEDRLADVLPDAVFLTDPSGVIREANPAASSLLGYARKYSYGKPLVSMVLPEAITTLQRKLEEVAALPQEKVLEWTAQLRSPRRERALLALVRVSTVRAADGTLLGLRWVMRDITAQHQTAQALAHLTATFEEQLRTRTAELDAITRMQATLIEQERAAREQAEAKLLANAARLTRIETEVEAFLCALGAEETAIRQVLQRVSEATEPQA